MATTIQHRGPDDDGVEILGQVGLAHRRLSIIDLSDAGRQPMSNEDGTVWIVYNGEVYNFLELRKALREGHTFRSHTDTEVLIHLYEDEGTRMVEQLDGMFAFVIVDLKQRQVFLARDPFGIKPLFYSFDNERFVFGSEIKPLLASQEVTKEIDHDALNDYFDFQWIPAPRSIFRQVRKLPPAHIMHLDLTSWKMRLHRYWQPIHQPEDGRTLEDWSEEVEHALKESVRRQLISDVPLGTFLSGGIDSTLVTHHAALQTKGKLKTFTIDFREQESSEAESARLVAQKLSTDAVFRTLSHDSLNHLPDLVEYYDEPFADSSMLPTSAVSRVAREEVTVVLSGDGGDELFTGYRHHDLAGRLRLLDRLPNLLTWGLFGALATLTPRDTRMHEWSQRFGLPPLYRRASLLRLPGRPVRRDIVAPEIRDDIEARSWHIEAHANDLKGLPPITQVQLYDLLFYLPNDMLVKVDRASMACSLEVRVPLLNRHLAELAFRIPESIRFQQDTQKPILRHLVAQHFGQKHAYRAKQGFSIPQKRWFTEAASNEMEANILNGAAVHDGYLSAAGIRRLFANLRRGGGRVFVDRSEELFTLFVFHTWWNRYMNT